jgi:hypothetical protein
MVDIWDDDSPDYTWAEEMCAGESEPSSLVDSFKPVLSSDFHLVPEPKWQIEDLTQRRLVHLNFGEPGSIKTFCEMEIAACTVTGLPAFGHFPVYERGDAVIFEGEAMPDFARNRWPAWCHAHGLDPKQSDFDGCRLAVIPKCPIVKDGREVPAAIEAIERLGLNPVHIGIDTVERAMVGLNETETSDLAYLISAAQGLAKYFQCGVSLLHHPPDGNKLKPRGGTSLPGAMDIMWLHSKLTADFSSTLTNIKMKGGVTGASYKLQGSLHLTGLTGQSGSPTRSLVFRYVGPVAAQETMRPKTKTELESEWRACVISAMRLSDKPVKMCFDDEAEAFAKEIERIAW